MLTQTLNFSPVSILESQIGLYYRGFISILPKIGSSLPPQHKGIPKLMEAGLEALKEKILSKLLVYTGTFLSKFSKPQAKVFRFKNDGQKVKPSIKMEAELKIVDKSVEPLEEEVRTEVTNQTNSQFFLKTSEVKENILAADKEHSHLGKRLQEELLSEKEDAL